MCSQIDEVSIRHLKYALAIADAGSVSAAASRLHVAQPSLSQQLRKLENRLNVKLFTRVSGGVRPTTEGEVFFGHARFLIVNFEDAVDELKHVNLTWNVGISPGVSTEIVEAVESMLLNLSERQRHSVSFISASSTELLQSLKDGCVDFGVVRLPFNCPTLMHTPISVHKLGVVVAKGHPLTRRKSVSWDALKSMHLLWFDSGRAPGFATYVIRHLMKHGWFPEWEEVPNRHSLFRHRLLMDPSLVALRPAYSVDADSALRWLPFASDAPVEQIVLAAVRGTRAARIVSGLDFSSAG